MARFVQTDKEAQGAFFPGGHDVLAFFDRDKLSTKQKEMARWLDNLPLDDMETWLQDPSKRTSHMIGGSHLAHDPFFWSYAPLRCVIALATALPELFCRLPCEINNQHNEDNNVQDLFEKTFGTGGATALHHALYWRKDSEFRCSSRDNDSILNFLLEMSPHSAGVRDVHGQLPLHILCSKMDLTVTSQFMFHLLQRYRSALKSECSKIGGLPVHIACQTGSLSQDLFRQLIAADSSTTQAPCESVGGRLPIHILSANLGNKQASKQQSDTKNQRWDRMQQRTLNRKETYLLHLLEINPHDISLADPVTRTLPFMLTAMKGEENLTMTYTLLQKFVGIQNLE